MNLKPALITALFSAAAFMPQHAQAGIASFNGTCPGGIEVHADDGGPVFVNGREASLRRFNENYFEARDAKSGTTLSITRTPDGDTQMSYTGPRGANGVCSIGSAALSVAAARHDSHRDRGDSSATEVTCESNGNEQAECAMDTRGEVEVVRRLSRSSCEQGEDWGLNRHSVWVRNGCRAVFRNVSSSNGYGRSWSPAQSGGSGQNSADGAVAACKSALALKSGENAVFVLPISHVPAAGGYEVFLNLKGKQWLCTTDSRGNVNRMDQR